MKRKYFGALAALTIAVLGASTRAQAAPFDQQFIDSMVPHHQMAIEMAQMAVRRARHRELRTMARKMIAEQQREIAQLKAWRKAWYGSAAIVPPPMSGHMMGLPMPMHMDMQKLMNSRHFDRDFLRMMVPHHSGAIMMAHAALQITARAQLRGFAHKLIDSQAKEIGDMRALHRRWYGRM